MELDEAESVVTGPDVVAFVAARMGEREIRALEYHHRDCASLLGSDSVPYPCNCGEPEHVLREVAAMRAIVAHVASWEHDSGPDDGGYYSCPLSPGSLRAQDDDWDGASCYCGLALRQEAILRPLAAIWSEHADYRAEQWTP